MDIHRKVWRGTFKTAKGCFLGTEMNVLSFTKIPQRKTARHWPWGTRPMAQSRIARGRHARWPAMRAMSSMMSKIPLWAILVMVAYSHWEHSVPVYPAVLVSQRLLKKAVTVVHSYELCVWLQHDKGQNTRRRTWGQPVVVLLTVETLFYYRLTALPRARPYLFYPF